MKKFISSFLIFISLIILSSCGYSKRCDIVATNFVGYDFAKNVSKEKLSVSTLMPAGAEIHGYEPSALDISAVINSKIFIYVGGESDIWVEEIIDKIDTEKTIVISMFEVLRNNNGKLYGEEKPESAENHEEHEITEEEEYDEHVWNDLDNAAIIINAIKESIIKIDESNRSYYELNSNLYISKINNLKNDITELTKNRNDIPLVFGDKFPLLYFVKEFNLKYDAAFNGCDKSHDVSISVLKSLIETAEKANVKYIFVVELSQGTLANTIRNEIANDKRYGSHNGNVPDILTFYSMHNVSKDDYDLGLTYYDLMNKNYESLKLLLGVC